jgi:IS30 family transposase
MAKLKKSVGKHQKFNRLKYKERVIIENRYCIDKRTISDIARELGKAVSTISREINGKPRIGRGKYSADTSQSIAEENSKKQGRKSKFDYEPLYLYLVEKLEIGWSPEQVALRLPIEYPNDKRMRTSHEAIYQYIYSQIYRGGNGKVKQGCVDLRIYLARRHKRRAKKGFRKAQKIERDASLPSIERRPKEVDKRGILGHWEGDTMGSRQSLVRIKSINERVSGVVLFGKTLNGTAKECNKVLIERLGNIPLPHRKTLTQDRGKENYEYENVEKALDVDCFFAHPYCSHERGSNENTNGLFRRYFPKRTDFGKIKDQQVAKVEYLLNTRPRKRLAGLTPYEVFYHMTGVALDS